jgi:hypothetical protein
VIISAISFFGLWNFENICPFGVIYEEVVYTISEKRCNSVEMPQKPELEPDDTSKTKKVLLSNMGNR